LPTIAITCTKLPESSGKEARVQQAIAACKKTTKKARETSIQAIDKDFKTRRSKFQGGLQSMEGCLQQSP
jgi:hypothetical protein